MTDILSDGKSGRTETPRSPSVYVIAGEASGDWAGSLLARVLRERLPSIVLRGIGGRRMAAAGVELVADSSGWGAIGVSDALLRVPRVWFTLRNLHRELERTLPHCIVFIDSGAVNIPLARMTQKLNLKRLYYLPPGSWSRKPRSGALRDLVDVIAAPFPWAKELMAGGRARVEWVGHPVLESARPSLSPEEAWRRYELDPTRPVVAFAPGSREQELRHVLPVMVGAASLLSREWSQVQFIVPVSTPDYEKHIRDAFKSAQIPVKLLDGMEYDALQLASAAGVCSGTATLEFACLGIPMVVVYRAGTATTAQFLLLRGLFGNQWRAGMPNIIAERDIVPELLWRYARPKALARELSTFLRDRARSEAVREDLGKLRESLGDGRATERTAELVLELLEQQVGGIASAGH